LTKSVIIKNENPTPEVKKEKPLNIIDKIRLDRLRQSKENEIETKSNKSPPKETVESKQQTQNKSENKNEKVHDGPEAKNLVKQNTNTNDQFDYFNDEPVNEKIVGEQKETSQEPPEEQKETKEENFNDKPPQQYLPKKNTFTSLLDEKPTLSKVPTAYKLKAVKKMISYVEQFSKSKKPGTMVYSTKIINQVSQKIVHDLFYDVLGNDKFDFSASDPELLISTIGEILYSNPNHNLNMDAVNDDTDIDNSLDKESKEIFTVVLEHFKKMIQEKKTSLPISSNFLTQKINNFSDSSDTKNKLLPIMEKKLSVGKSFAMTGGFKSSGSFGGFAMGNNTQSGFKTTTLKKMTPSKPNKDAIDNYE